MALFDTRNKKIVSSAILLAVAIALFVMLKVRQAPRSQYITNQGNVFGTTYNIQYQAMNDLEDSIKLALKGVDNSLSMFNSNSTISKINNGETQTDSHFLTVFNKAAEVYKLSEGGFDITVSPLVYAWGFGKNKDTEKPKVAPTQIDSILTFVGFHKIHLNGDQLTKDDPRITLDCSAIAKGYGCDVVARTLEKQGIENYMVEIGGEVVCRGVNEKGNPWRIGINTPEDDLAGANHETQCIIAGNLNLATSGSYRQFYYEDGIRRSHTVDPRTGYPVSNNLLSATVISKDCMTADALATACMVMGLETSIDVIEQLPETECFLIYDLDGEHLVRQSSGFGKYIVK